MSRTRLVVVVAVGTLALVLAVGWLLPSRWRAERSIVIQAAPQAIYPLVADFKTGWPTWSPFGQAQDPGMKMHYDGPEVGVGAVQSWTESKAGDGHMRIVRADPATGVTYQLTMDNGFALTGTLTLARLDDTQTRVTWVDAGELGANPLWHYVGLMLESVEGRTFEQGLAALKERVEGHANPTGVLTPAAN